MEVVRLDDELRPDFGRLKGRVGAVKMDIEGAEALVRVLGGAGFGGSMDFLMKADIEGARALVRVACF